MAKIIIYEDHYYDVILRYRKFTQNNEVHVYLLEMKNTDPEISSLHFSFYVNLLGEAGFKREHIHEGIGNPQDENADLYFVDGLEGKCFEILDKLPQDKVYLNSGDYTINKEADKRKIQTVGIGTLDRLLKICSNF